MTTCCQRIFGPRVTNWQCRRKGVVLDPAGWHCIQHSDAAKAKRADSSSEKWGLQAMKEANRNTKLHHFAALFDIAAEVSNAHPNERLRLKAKALVISIKKELGYAAI